MVPSLALHMCIPSPLPHTAIFVRCVQASAEIENGAKSSLEDPALAAAVEHGTFHEETALRPVFTMQVQALFKEFKLFTELLQEKQAEAVSGGGGMREGVKS